MLKSISEIVTAVAARLARTWHTEVADVERSWPHTFPLGTVTRTELEAQFPALQQQALAWQEWTERNQLDLTWASRRVHRSAQPMPTHVTVADIDTATAVAGGDWPARLRRGRQRARRLHHTFPTGPAARILRETDKYTPTDFDLLIAAACWFRNNNAAGLTPRQVPIPGLHAKWLNTSRHLIAALAERDDLGLLPEHPPRIHFTYLDPAHRAAGGRWHDSATVGDTMTPAYQPHLIVISENKDTAIHFPALPNAISVEGDGFGAAAVASIPWLAAAPHLIYWGDMDAHGFEIVDNFRREGLPIRTILMDQTTYERYEKYGSSTDAQGRPLKHVARKPLLHLTAIERTLYEHLTDPNWTRYLRIEQERIPLQIAADAVGKATRETNIERRESA